MLMICYKHHSACQEIKHEYNMGPGPKKVPVKMVKQTQNNQSVLSMRNRPGGDQSEPIQKEESWVMWLLTALAFSEEADS